MQTPKEVFHLDVGEQPKDVLTTFLICSKAGFSLRTTEIDRVMTFFTSSLSSIDENTLDALSVLLALTIGFSVSRLFYGWVGKAGLRTAGVSPTLASILTAELVWLFLSPINLE